MAPNQLRLRSKFIASPWQHRGNKQQCLDRSWYLPDAQNSPPPPWLFPEGGVSGSQVHGKKSRVGVAFGPRKVGSAPPPSADQRRGSSMPGPWSKGAGSGDELWVFYNLDVSRPNCLLSQPKMDPSGAADYIREDSLFSQRRPDKRGASVPLAIWSQNNRKGPRKGGKKKEKRTQPSQHRAMKERSSVWIDGMAEQISKHTVKPRTFTQIGSQSKSANRAAWCDEQVRKLLMDLSGLEILSCTTRDVGRMEYFFFILFLSCERSKGFWNILKTDIKESLKPKYPNIGKDQSLLPAPHLCSVTLHCRFWYDPCSYSRGTINLYYFICCCFQEP